ncbi:hypothetical protein GCM10009601_25040 [Streptomyces thermospinosisporus]|uniref:Uncharacterized protein n=1 Tax=Streptomyces thermospinosisporus TaxID=161482 RepID=A0ABP4JIM5_9ACTN
MSWLTSDQILENATGVGAPPSTWPRRELVVDVLPQDRLRLRHGIGDDAVAARGGPGPGLRHAGLRAGRHPAAAPVRRADAFGR